MSTGQIYIYYPRGFRRFVIGDMPQPPQEDHAVNNAEGHQVVYSNGDDEVAELYRRYTATEDTSSWEFHNTVLTCAKRLIPHLRSFVVFQAQNARLHGNGLGFLEDIVAFVESGRCAMKPLTAYELIEDHPPRNESAKHHRQIRPPNCPSFFQDGIVCWVSHDRGFEHLIETLFVLFGPARIEQERELPIRTLSERKLTNGWMKISDE